MRKQLLTLLLCAPLLCSAQEKTRLIGIGGTSLLDTYLSPEKYKGEEYRIIYSSMKPLKKDSLWSRTLQSQGFISRSKPRSKDANYLGGMYEFCYGMHRKVVTTGKLNIAIGAQADIFIGGLYNTRNGNNPAQLKLGADIAPSLQATYVFRQLKKNMKWSYRISAPLAGLQFAPAYGQSYYEIFNEGDYDNNIKFTSPFNAPSLTQMLTMSIPLKKYSITFGYLGDYRQAKLNNQKYHQYTHSLLIGWTL